MAEVAGIGDKLKANEQQLAEIQSRIANIALGIPNLADASVPQGKDESENVEQKKWGTPRTFEFAPKDHVELGARNGWLDGEAAAKLSGARFTVLRGGLAQLHRALAQFMLDLHTREHGYLECNVPLMVNAETMQGTGQLPKFEDDLFAIAGERASLSDSDRRSFADQSRRERNRARRSAAAAHDRTHAVLPRRSRQLRQGHARHDPSAPVRKSGTGEHRKTVRKLRRTRTHDALCGKSAGETRTAVSPRAAVHGRHGFRGGENVRSRSLVAVAEYVSRDFVVFELHAISRRDACGARWRNPETGKNELVHTLNGSGTAVGRALIAVMENYQNADGTITIPTALRSYMDEKDRIE